MSDSKTSMSALRFHLFDVIERLKESVDPKADPKDSITIDAAKAINETAKAIISSAKVEVDAIKIIASSDNLVVEAIVKQSGAFQLNEKNN